LRTILTIIVGMLALSVHAQEIYTGAIAISPSQRTNSWRPTNTLAPGDSAKLSITVAQSGSDNGRNYTLYGNPIQHPPISSPPGSIIWRGTYSSLHACNAGNSPGTTTATVTAEWVETGSGGGGSGGSPSIIYGKATGIAQADIPVFNWSFDRRMQYADGTSPITYTVTGSITGRRVTMSPYSVKPLSGELSVTPDPLSSTNIRTGKITSTSSAKSKMGVYYGERELARSTNEIAFGKVDLIVPQGPGTNGGTPLPEDRLTNGGAAPATNELNPGTFVLLLPQDQTNRVATTLTLKADPTGGSVTLDQHGLTDLKIYTDEALQDELTMPKTWTNGETPPSTLYMVGSSSSTNLQSAQGTLNLTYKANSAASGGEYSVKDTVGVTLLPVQIKYAFRDMPRSDSDYKPFKRPQRYLMGQHAYFKCFIPQNIIPPFHPTWKGTFGLVGYGITTDTGYSTGSVSVNDSDFKTVIADFNSSEVIEKIIACRYAIGIHSNVPPESGFTNGHAWISITDWITGSPITTTYGLWPDNHPNSVDNGPGSDVRINQEPSKTGSYNRYFLLLPSEHGSFVSYSNQVSAWSYFNTCANWAEGAFDAATGEHVSAQDLVLFGTPRKISESIAALEAAFSTEPNAPKESDIDPDGSSSVSSTWNGSSFTD
jgi:hypothetical protein